MEYAKDAEAIKGNDLKQNLNSEKTKCLELMDKLNQEKKKLNNVQEQLCDLKEEISKLKEHINIDSKNHKNVWLVTQFNLNKIQINFHPFLIFFTLALNSKVKEKRTKN